MVSANASDRKTKQPVPGKGLREDFHHPAVVNADPESVASRFCLRRLGVRVKLARKGVSVFIRQGRKLGDEGLHPIAARIFESCGATEICGVCLYKRWIEIVLTNQQAQLVTQSRLAVAGAV